MTVTSSATEPPVSLAADFPAANEAQWRTLVDKVLKDADFAKRLVTRTADGIEIEPLYARTHALPGIEDARPGIAPFTRGSVLRLAAGGWQIAELHTETEPAALAAALAEAIAAGAEAITIRLAAPGQSGLPADFRVIEAALARVPLDRVRISLQPGSHAIHSALALTTIARQRGAPGCVGALGIDPLGTLARTGELVIMRPDGKGFAVGLPWLPAPATTLLADARPYHEAGASEAQEIAALLGTLVAYLRGCEGEGMPPAQALPRIALALAVDADLFLGVAKLRAARRLVARVAEACGAADGAGRMQLAVITSARMMARRDPWVNMLRVTAACSAAAIGGADEIGVLPHTWALGQPDAFARRIARNVGLVLREEASLGRIADAAGGAWYLEQLTSQLAAKAWSIFQEWEGEGGMQAALVSGLVLDQIAAVAQARATDIATRRIELTGVSAYPQLGDDGVKVEPWPNAPAGPTAPIARPLLPQRLAEPFERLRDKADRRSVPPKVFLAALGTMADHTVRTMWITNLLAAGGVGVIAGDGYTNSADVGRAFAESGATVACICSSDQVYGELGEAAAMALEGAGAARVYLAGRPGAQEAALKAAGVDRFLYAGIDVVAALDQLLDIM